MIPEKYLVIAQAIKIASSYLDMLEHTHRYTDPEKRENEHCSVPYLPPSTVHVNLGRSPIRNGPTTVEMRVWLNSAVIVNDFGGSERKKVWEKEK